LSLFQRAGELLVEIERDNSHGHTYAIFVEPDARVLAGLPGGLQRRFQRQQRRTRHQPVRGGRGR
jgi:hypothetical protein